MTVMIQAMIQAHVVATCEAHDIMALNSTFTLLKSMNHYLII